MTEHFTHRAARAWIKISVTTPASRMEEIADFLTALTGTGIETISLTKETECLIAYLPEEDASPEKLAGLKAHIDNLRDGGTDADSVWQFKTERIEEEDWSRNWKKHFQPLHINAGLVITPTWEEYIPGPEEVVVTMDPGMAFGTGHHESTRLALELISKLAAKTQIKDVLDVGTGTGILAIVCGLYKACKVIAIDNDPDAVAAARENVRINKVSAAVDVRSDDISRIPGRFDLVIANITHDVLITLADELNSRLAAGGHLILAGILVNRQGDSIAEHFTALGLKVTEQLSLGEWTAFCFHKSDH